MRQEQRPHTQTVGEVLEERLKAVLQERIGNLLPGPDGDKSTDDLITELAGELADEAQSALGLRQSELDEPWCEEEEETDGQIPRNDAGRSG